MKKGCIALAIGMTVVGILAYMGMNTENGNEFESILEKLENTLNANSYTVTETDRGSFYDVQKDGDIIYIAKQNKKALEDKYTRYDYLAINQTKEYGGFDEFKQGDDVSSVNEDTEYAYLNKIAAPTVEEIFAIATNDYLEIEDFDNEEDYYIHKDKIAENNSNNYKGIIALISQYKSGNPSFDFVQQFDINEERMYLSFKHEEFIEWCEANMEEDNQISTISKEDVYVRFTITFDDEYVKKIIKMIGDEETGFESEDLTFRTVWSFSNIDETLEDLEDYIKDPNKYFDRVLKDVNSKVITRIKSELEVSPNGRYDADGQLVNESGNIESLSDYIDTYTGDEMISYLEGNEDLPDKENDWRVKYINFIDENKNDVLRLGFKDSDAWGVVSKKIQIVDIDKDGAMELLLKFKDEWGGSMSFVIYLDYSNVVRYAYTSDDAKYHKDYYYYKSPVGLGDYGGYMEDYNYVYRDNNTGKLIYDIYTLCEPSWAESSEDIEYSLLTGYIQGQNDSGRLSEISSSAYFSGKDFWPKREADEEFTIQNENNDLMNYASIILNY